MNEAPYVIHAGMRATFTVALLAMTLAGCTGDGGFDGSLGEGTELPSGHAALSVLASGAVDLATFSAAASEQDLHFVCGAGGGPASWQLCLVADPGVLAVVPFEAVDGLVARVRSPASSEDVLIRLEARQPVGALRAASGGSVDIEYDGEVIGELSMP